MTLAVNPNLATSQFQHLQTEQQFGAPQDVAAMEEAAIEFEGVFVSMLLKEMRQTLQDGLFGSEGSDAYGALFDMYMGKHLSEHAGLGIREMVTNYFQSPNELADDSNLTTQPNPDAVKNPNVLDSTSTDLTSRFEKEYQRHATTQE